MLRDELIAVLVGAQDHRDRRQRRSGGRDACRDANLDPSSDQHCHAQLNVGGSYVLMLDVRRIGICEEDHGGSWMIRTALAGRRSWFG